MESARTAIPAESKMRNSGSVENGITIREPDEGKTAGKLNPKLSVFREFVLATAHCFAEALAIKQSSLASAVEGRRQFFACDLIAQSGIAGLQWKRRLGDEVHVTLVEQREPQALRDNAGDNGFALHPLPNPMDPQRPPGFFLPRQASSELHLARWDPLVLLQLEAFDFVYLDPLKNPAPYFSSLFRNVRNGGVVCVVIPDTMQFARSPHVVRRCYGAHCMKTEYLKELASRIILAALAVEAARCHKALTVLYTVCMEDFLLLAVRVERGPRLADHMLQSNVGHLLHCRMCEERAFYPANVIAPVDDPYSLLSCDCSKNIPGKTGVILGPLWKGGIYDYTCLTRLAASGRTLNLSPPFFSLLQRLMEDCSCDSPPSLATLCRGPHPSREDLRRLAGNGDVPSETPNGGGGGGGDGERVKRRASRGGMEDGSDETKERDVPTMDGGDDDDDDDDGGGGGVGGGGGGGGGGTAESGLRGDSGRAAGSSRTGGGGDGGEDSKAQSPGRKSSPSVGGEGSGNRQSSGRKSAVDVQKMDDGGDGSDRAGTDGREKHGGSSSNSDGRSSVGVEGPETPSPCGTSSLSADNHRDGGVEVSEARPSGGGKSSGVAPAADLNADGSRGIKRAVSLAGSAEDSGGTSGKRSKGVGNPAPGSAANAQGSRPCQGKGSDGVVDPAPCFFYNMHSKRLGTDHMPRHQAVIDQLRARGYRCCRTHFERYAIRTDASLKTLKAVLGSADNKVLYVRGSEGRGDTGSS